MGWVCAYCQGCSRPAGDVETTKIILKDWVTDHLGYDFHYKCLAKSYRAQRINLNIGLREMAKIIGISPSYLHDLENGKRKWSKKISKQYTDVLIKTNQNICGDN